MKTLVQASHYGTGENGFGGCNTRWSSPEGYCSGRANAIWLNSLGEDEEPFTKYATNGEVRRNWLRGGHCHIELASNPPNTYDCPRCAGTGRIHVKP